MITNKLKINNSKTEFIVCRSPQLRLVQEAKEKSDASEDKFYLVRGSPFKPLIVEIEKKK